MTESLPAPTGGVDAYCSSGPSPTPRLHLLGVGAVGRAYLQLHPEALVVGASDSRGTALDPHGLDIAALVREKAAGRSVVSAPEFLHTWDDDVQPSATACVVVDVTPTDFARGPADATRIRDWLARGQAVALASKHALAADPDLLTHPRLGANAVLGGTGAALQRELPDLRASWTEVALAGNASTTTIITCIEDGGTFADGLAMADRAGVLEPNPELDLRGADAAVKVALVVGALTGNPVDPATVDVQDLREVPESVLRETARSGRTTRLVGRADRVGPPSLRYEAVDRTHPLAVGPEGVCYAYARDDDWRVHRGTGVGAPATARALASDIERLWRLA
ncbi:MAG: hypothetical protein AAF211_05145 [Myxococcota bacterium]